MKKAVEKILKYFRRFNDKKLKNVEIMPNKVYFIYENETEEISINDFVSMVKKYLIAKGYKLSIYLDEDKTIVEAKRENEKIKVEEKEEYMAIFELLKKIEKIN